MRNLRVSNRLPFGTILLCLSFLASSLKAQESTLAYDLPGNLSAVMATNAIRPSITTQPQSVLLYTNNPVTLSVIASGAGLSYQWYSNDVVMIGASTDSLVLTNASGNNLTNFTVVISNATGVVTSTPAAIWADSNGNGIPDWWELKYFGNLNQTADGDYDGDGVSNIDEYREGTIPNNANSFNPRLSIQKPNNGRVVASPDQPYYSMGQVVTMTAIPDTSQDFLGWSGAATGTKSSIALVMNSHKTVSASFGIPLPVALDNPNLVWTTGGSASWYGQTAVTEDGTNAAQSGLISNSQQTWLQAVASNLTQNCQLSFWWSVSSQSPDNLAFAIDGTAYSSIAGEAVGWKHVLANLTAGNHTLLWTYAKGSGDVPTGIPFTDSGWVDQVLIGVGPVITNQPVSQIVTQGGTATLSLAVTGTAPLSYQWYFNGTGLVGQNSANLTLNNIQPTSAGGYFAVASNTFGMATSSVAVVVVNSSSCTPPPMGLVSWWPGNGNALDIIGGNNGTLQGGATYTNGLVGQAFSFNGTSAYVSLNNGTTNLPLGKSPRTIAAWVRTTMTGLGEIFAYGAGNSGHAFTLGVSGASIFVSAWSSPQYFVNASVNDGLFHHVAVAYDGTNASVYVDGTLIDTRAFVINTAGGTANIGARILPTEFFNGAIDEVSIYNRALLPGEIAATFDAGAAGMCQPTPYFSLSASGTRWLTNGFSLQLGGLNGSGPVVIYASTNLVSWTPIYTNPPVIGSLQHVDSTATNLPMRYYRAVEQ